MRTPRDDRRSRSVLVLLALGSVSLISLDAGLGDGSPAGAARTAVSTVLGPVQSGWSSTARAVGDLGDGLGSDDDLREDNERLREANAALRSQLMTAPGDARRADAVAALDELDRSLDVRSVRAHVVGYGGAQSFARTVTLDVGTSDGVAADQSVVAPEGLVGRVVETSAHNATVLLVVDADSVVGGRLGSTGELGFLTGDGELSGDGSLSMAAIDATADVAEGDVVTTWGSPGDAPYVPGVPVGQVTSVELNPRDQSASATVVPFVDFSSLDVVDVVVADDDGLRAEGR